MNVGRNIQHVNGMHNQLHMMNVPKYGKKDHNFLHLINHALNNKRLIKFNVIKKQVVLNQVIKIVGGNYGNLDVHHINVKHLQFVLKNL